MNYKSKRAKATDIPMRVKLEVLNRDKVCIFCGRPGAPNAHYISRAHGGLGIERNIVTACTKCHNEMDNGKQSQRYKDIARDYLKSRYFNWREDELIYKKGV